MSGTSAPGHNSEPTADVKQEEIVTNVPVDTSVTVVQPGRDNHTNNNGQAPDTVQKAAGDGHTDPDTVNKGNDKASSPDGNVESNISKKSTVPDLYSDDDFWKSLSGGPSRFDVFAGAIPTDTDSTKSSGHVDTDPFGLSNPGSPWHSSTDPGTGKCDSTDNRGCDPKVSLELTPDINTVAGSYVPPNGTHRTSNTPDVNHTQPLPPGSGGPASPDLTNTVLTATTPILLFVASVTVALLGYSLWKPLNAKPNPRTLNL
ncbi:hypothetical protein AK88_05563 [Plasmodium fragile]|uniref:CD99 antigen n=1 Tax=Plasmodium fragile TaxID=5857 RepID=A0A0D9QCR6_PLAFR|nr:uncharacterized protein AK88_05563 [Plasmodium fragile]KJP84803.1 hypothetical protein AK88_05563 [Plasmodium fragile]